MCDFDFFKLIISLFSFAGLLLLRELVQFNLELKKIIIVDATAALSSVLHQHYCWILNFPAAH